MCAEGMEFGDFGVMTGDYITKKKNDSLFAVYPDGYGFKDVAMRALDVITDQLLVQHTFWVHANIRAGEFNTGQPWGRQGAGASGAASASGYPCRGGAAEDGKRACTRPAGGCRR